jgi:hypothetical protein
MTRHTQVLPVIAETSDRVRIVLDGRSSRFAVWIDKEATGVSVLSGVKLANREGLALIRSGVFMKVGRPVTIVKRDGGLVYVDASDDALSLFGHISARLLGAVWVRGQETSSREPPNSLIRADVAIHEAPTLGSQQLARTKTKVAAFARSSGPEWYEVAVETGYLRLTGFVLKSSVTNGTVQERNIATHNNHDAVVSQSSGQQSNLIYIESKLPRGTCLFANFEGEVLGVTLKSDTFEIRKSPLEGWWYGKLDSPIGSVDMLVHERGNERLRTEATWESCVD